ncbi:hypothetical protein [Sphingobium aromaticiconvertens]|uniref:hypothetical protein n=1 Tax=Sphingobium aromaticiconvertens TaxID=365341 RepID=UPI003019AE32
MQTSRTYKLLLSDQGIDLFLGCHCRLAHLVRAFIPYGVTLAAAVTFLESLDPSEIAAEVETRKFVRSCGTQVHFVGSSARLTESMSKIKEKLSNSSEFGSLPSVGKLYVVALISLEAAEDRQLMDAYHRAVR